MTSSGIDPLDLSKRLIGCPSVTPTDAGALDVLQQELEALGFVCQRLVFSEDGTADVDNLYARIGTAAPNFCFAGHTDVVPPGDLADWTSDPFQPTERDGQLFGRGASDMKCAIACMAAATSRFLAARGSEFGGSISFLITGDEEGPSINGTRKVLDWMTERGETIEACLVGEPTSVDELGDMVKIGRRGSMNAWITVHGTQGHSAYQDLADNPIPRLLAFLDSVSAVPLDDGTEHFPPSNLEITTIDVGNPATNVIPARAEARLNIRFNDLHTGDSLTRWLDERRTTHAGESEFSVRISGEAFLTPPGPLSSVIAEAVREVTGLETVLSTTGGTSDARFIKDVCPVAELGMLNRTAHKVDEHVAVEHVGLLADVYEAMLSGYFGGA